jgi:hypothetical protein
MNASEPACTNPGGTYDARMLRDALAAGISTPSFAAVTLSIGLSATSLAWCQDPSLTPPDAPEPKKASPAPAAVPPAKPTPVAQVTPATATTPTTAEATAATPTAPATPASTVVPTTPQSPDATAPLPVVTKRGDEQPAHSAGLGYVHQFSAGIGDNASMSADRFYGSYSTRVYSSDDLNVTLAMGYEFDWYHWSGVSELGVSDPFGSVNLFGFQARGSFKVADGWTASLGGIFAIAGESDADAGDSLYGGGIASIAWTPTANMMLGVGVLGVTQIENDPIIIPIPVLHWHFADDWLLSTIRRPPASPFVGVDVAWEPEGSKADVAFGIGWQLRRFRLGTNSDPTINNGVGEDQSWAAFVSVGYDFTPACRVDMLVGTTFYEQLQVQDSNGSNRRSTTVDPNALLGVFLTINY